ncbi:putative alpha-galactosidase B [Aspergillus pseudoustus]|uniref:Alpha-galactosidase n=1 Tax=Aspergillus pseudoustus TaxID=1810923 RepID=A0ABR4JVX3_9EURO
MLTSAIAIGTSIAALVGRASALDSGVGKLPKLGYNTFNAFECGYDADVVLSQAQAMKDLGLVDLGYNSFLFDDCMTEKTRNSKGRLVASAEKFPNGLKKLTSQLKKLGVSSSAYSDAGVQTCAGYPGSFGHEAQDLESWEAWGFDYLKYDNCYIPFDNVTQENVYGRYKRMSDAIAARAAKKHSTPFQFSLCEWGWQQPWVWARQLGQSWRVNGDIKPWWSSIASIINTASFISSTTDFYGRNDFDILEVGNFGQGSPQGNMTDDEEKSHFTAWALLKSPMLISANLTNISSSSVEVLSNQDLLRINQDPHVGASISPFRWGINEDFTFNETHPAQYWTGNSSYGVVFMVLNTLDTVEVMSFNLTESWAIRAGRLYDVYDMWSHTHNGTAYRNVTVTLPPHGVAALLLNDAGPEEAGIEPYCAGWWQCSWPNGTYYSN